ncbi:MAG: hypothetical protein ACP5IZ_05380, partial [Thermoprotei archaeon]
FLLIIFFLILHNPILNISRILNRSYMFRAVKKLMISLRKKAQSVKLSPLGCVIYLVSKSKLGLRIAQKRLETGKISS